jgi:hypothetical protein
VDEVCGICSRIEFYFENLKGRHFLRDLRVDGNIKWTFKMEYNNVEWNNLVLGWRPVVGFSEHNNEHSVSIKGKKW